MGEKEEKKRRGEKGSSFSLVFPGDPNVGVRRSRRQSRSPQRELRMGTEIGEFRQAPRGRVFLLLGLILV